MGVNSWGSESNDSVASKMVFAGNEGTLTAQSNSIVQDGLEKFLNLYISEDFDNKINKKYRRKNKSNSKNPIQPQNFDFRRIYELEKQHESKLVFTPLPETPPAPRPAAQMEARRKALRRMAGNRGTKKLASNCFELVCVVRSVFCPRTFGMALWFTMFCLCAGRIIIIRI